MPSDKQRLYDRDYYGEYQKKSCYTVEQWEKILSNEAFVSPTEMAILKEIFASANHAAPLSQLSFRHKKDPSYFLDKMNQLAQNIGTPNGYSVDVDYDGNEYWWYLLFWGKKNKLSGLEWKLIPELAEAMEYMFPDLEDKYNTYMSEIERSEQIRYTKEDSVWIASALLLFEKVYIEHPIDIYDLLLMQYEISQRAQKIYGQDVDIDVITDNCNADSGRCVFPYLRDIDKYWRVCYPGELEDSILRPEKIDYNAYVPSKFGYVKLSELVEFIEGDYCKLTDPNYVEIDTSNPFYKMISFIRDNGGKRYMDLTAPTEEDIERFLAQKDDGKEALNAFHDLSSVLKEQYPSFASAEKSGWLERDNTTIRRSWLDSFETKEMKGVGPLLSFMAGENDNGKIVFSVVLTFPIESAELNDQIMNKCSNLTLLTSANFRVEKSIHLDSMFSTYFGNAICAFAEFDEHTVLDLSLQDINLQFETAIQILASYYLDVCETIYLPRLSATPEPESSSTAEIPEEVAGTPSSIPAPTVSMGGSMPVYMAPPAPQRRITPVKEHPDRKDTSFTLYPKNIIFCGSDGCGKMQMAIQNAVGIIEGIPLDTIQKEDFASISKRYQDYLAEGRILYDASSYDLPHPDSWMDSPAGEGAFTAFCNHIEKGRYVCILEHTNSLLLQEKMGSAYYLLKENRREGQEEGACVELPHSENKFSVPMNLHIILTSSDSYGEQSFDSDIFHLIKVSAKEIDLDNLIIKGLSLRYLVEAMNKRLSYLLTPDYQIGQHYFDSLRDNKTVEALGHIMHEVIVPKLIAWFHEGKELGLYSGEVYEGVRLVLGDYKKSEKAYEMIQKETLNPTALFGAEMELPEKTIYRINKDAFFDLNSYLELE